MTASPPLREPPERGPAGKEGQAESLHRALMIGLLAVVGLVLVAIVVVMVIVITHGGGVHMVE
jgi:hypothetical protein